MRPRGQGHRMRGACRWDPCVREGGRLRRRPLLDSLQQKAPEELDRNAVRRAGMPCERVHNRRVVPCLVPGRRLEAVLDEQLFGRHRIGSRPLAEERPRQGCCPAHGSRGRSTLPCTPVCGWRVCRTVYLYLRRGSVCPRLLCCVDCTAALSRARARARGLYPCCRRPL